jgi:CheY-like chemotaxis protein
LPQISGLEVCRLARKQCVDRALRIIAYTAHAMPQEIQELHEAGFDGVLVKPIRRQDLIEALAVPSKTDLA